MEIGDRASPHRPQAQGHADAQSLLDQVLSFSGQKVSDEEVIEALGIIDRKILHETIQAWPMETGVVSSDREAVYNFGYDLKEFCGELAS